MKRRIRLTEADLHRVIKESVQKVLTEVDWSTYPESADFRGKDAWWKQQVDQDFPGHGVKDSRDWKEVHREHSIQREREQKRANSKLARQQSERMMDDEQEYLFMNADELFERFDGGERSESLLNDVEKFLYETNPMFTYDDEPPFPHSTKKARLYTKRLERILDVLDTDNNVQDERFMNSAVRDSKF